MAIEFMIKYRLGINPQKVSIFVLECVKVTSWATSLLPKATKGLGLSVYYDNSRTAGMLSK
jgi:hypothetical protein